MSVREASHAGSWYTNDGKALDASLSEWLAAVSAEGVPSAEEVVHPEASGSKEAQSSRIAIPVPGCRAIIAPHAGYSYSGPAAAWAYKCIDTAQIETVFILGPSHHFYLKDCALTQCSAYETPIGNLPIDSAVNAKLFESGHFSEMSLGTDEDEHSIEMHLPYVRKVFEGKDIKIVPILVGRLSTASQDMYGKLLAPYLADPKTLFVISSDFCHWGQRFQYTYYRAGSNEKPQQLRSGSKIQSSETDIWESIRDLDAEGIAAISHPGSGKAKSAKQAVDDFRSYLADTKNTVCGAMPIALLLSCLARLEADQGIRTECRFVRYEQSSQCHTVRDSSVSYASAFVRFLE